MPIRPENRCRYPKNWAGISKRIRLERAKGRCECEGECGVAHDEEPIFASAWAISCDDTRCRALHGEVHPITDSMVVLTVAHLDQQPENCDDGNLKAMCQRCHNRLDGPHRRAGVRARLRATKAIGDLFVETIDGRPIEAEE